MLVLQLAFADGGAPDDEEEEAAGVAANVFGDRTGSIPVVAPASQHAFFYVTIVSNQTTVFLCNNS